MTTPEKMLYPQAATRACRECATEFELPPFRLAAELVHVCPACSERHAEQDQRDASVRAGCYREESWKKICPVIFQDTEAMRLPSPSKLDLALRWSYGRQGLLLYGASGRGKSRIAWAILKREFMAGKSVEVLDCTFGFQYSSKFAVSAGDASRWVGGLMTVDLLLLDDVLKVKLTDSVEQALFAIVNSRTERGLPIIVTTNDTGESLAARMSDDRGPALLRRLREFSTTISFT
jgi:DNA replication protein DnaC